MKDLKSRLKLKTVKTVKEVCEELRKSSQETAIWIKIFSKSLLKELLNTEDPEIFIALSSSFWAQDQKLWNQLLEQFLSAKKLRRHHYWNSLLRFGDERCMTALEEALDGSLLDVSGFHEPDWPDRSSEIDLITAKQIACFRGNIEIGVISISDEVASILSQHRGMMYPGFLFKSPSSNLSSSRFPDSKGFIKLARKFVDQTDSGPLTFYASELPVRVAGILGQHKGELNLGYLESLSVGSAKQLARRDDSGSWCGLTIGHSEGRPFQPDEGALSEFRNHTGSLSVSGLDELSLEDAIGLAEHNGNLAFSLKRWPTTEILDHLMKHQKNLDFGFVGDPYPSFPSIEVDLAKVLASFNGTCLFINGASGVSDEAVGYLSSLKGKLRIHNIDEAGISNTAINKLRESGVDGYY